MEPDKFAQTLGRKFAIISYINQRVLNLCGLVLTT